MNPNKVKATMTNPNPLEERGEVERALWRPFLLLALPIMLAGGLAMWLGSRDLRQSTDPGGWVPLGVGAIFELIGVAMTVALKYGDSVLHLRVIPLTPGGALEGVIQVPRRLHPRDGFTLRLLCVNQITSGSGKHRHTREEKLWQIEQAVAADRLETAPRSLKIPVAFRLATDAPPSRKAGQAEVLWRLEARARIPGLDYATHFVLPVFAAKPVTR